ncbi:ABC transporter permease [Acuticoccus sp.]|uniref:ABC transporter permease n=1 Tax=Acuticoccus sp. TaxID=1904378 RepID=UPI003B51CB76
MGDEHLRLGSLQHGSRATRLRSLGGVVLMGARALAAILLVVLVWWALVAVLRPPRYVFPSPLDVAEAYASQGAMLLRNAGITALEILLGLGVGVSAGVLTALVVAATPLARRLVLPVVVATQALPVFAIAPLLVVWLGYGIASKVAMAALIIYFPVATAYAEAMTRVDPRLLDLARLAGAGRFGLLWRIRAPGGLPGLAAGVKVAATVAPIGAVVGEWVGASAGLGFVMVNANARSQTGTVFAALFLLALLALGTRALADRLVERLLWRDG